MQRSLDRRGLGYSTRMKGVEGGTDEVANRVSAEKSFSAIP